MSSGCCATCVHFQMASAWDRVLKDQARAELAREAGFTLHHQGPPYRAVDGMVDGQAPQLPADWVDFSAWTGGPGDGWCWWVHSHQGMVEEVPVWMLRAGRLDGRARRVPMNVTLGADCRQWRARL